MSNIILFCMFSAVIILMYRKQTRLVGRMQIEKQKSDAEALQMRTAVNNARDGIIILDINARIIWANPSWCEMFQYELSEIVGLNPMSFVLAEEDRPPQQEIDEFRYDPENTFFESYEIVHNIRKNGERCWNALSHAHHLTEAGEHRIVVTCRDVTEQIHQEEELKKSLALIAFRADHDPLTSVANRARLGRVFNETRDHALATGKDFGLLHIDLDHFKSVNDTFGHAAGDAVIIKATDRMRALIGPRDMLARIGGDEFVILCPDAQNHKYLRQLAENVIAEVSKPIRWEDRALKVGASIGACLSSETASDYATMMQNSDLALYKAKEQGRGQVACYDHDMDRSNLERTQLASELIAAIEECQLDVYVQPQYSLIAKTITGFEALVRWHHPVRGLLAPKDFLDVASEIGVIEDIDKYVATRAIATLRQLSDAGHRGLQMAVNVSPRSMAQGRYPDFLKWEADRQNIPFEQIAVEILETTFLSETQGTVARTIDALSKAGFQVKLDDFGTGYAGLSHLGRLKVDGVKIDKSMVMDLTDNVTNQIIVQAMVGLSSDLGIHVIAEGVINQQVARILRQFGCVTVQGDGVAPAMPIKDVPKWLRTADMSNILPLGRDESRSSHTAAS